MQRMILVVFASFLATAGAQAADQVPRKTDITMMPILQLKRPGATTTAPAATPTVPKTATTSAGANNATGTAPQMTTAAITPSHGTATPPKTTTTAAPVTATSSAPQPTTATTTASAPSNTTAAPKTTPATTQAAATTAPATTTTTSNAPAAASGSKPWTPPPGRLPDSVVTNLAFAGDKNQQLASGPPGFQVNQVPEPGTMLLVGIGAVGLAISRRRKV